jgi:hypothetical protein
MIAYLIFMLGKYMGERHMIKHVIAYSCEQMEDRKSYEMCVLTVEQNFKKEKK